LAQAILAQGARSATTLLLHVGQRARKWRLLPLSDNGAVFQRSRRKRSTHPGGNTNAVAVAGRGTGCVVAQPPE